MLDVSMATSEFAVWCSSDSDSQYFTYSHSWPVLTFFLISISQILSQFLKTPFFVLEENKTEKGRKERRMRRRRRRRRGREGKKCSLSSLRCQNLLLPLPAFWISFTRNCLDPNVTFSVKPNLSYLKLLPPPPPW